MDGLIDVWIRCWFIGRSIVLCFIIERQANVMLEYSYEEAIEVLEKSLSNAKERLVRTACQ